MYYFHYIYYNINYEYNKAAIAAGDNDEDELVALKINKNFHRVKTYSVESGFQNSFLQLCSDLICHSTYKPVVVVHCETSLY